MDLLMGIIEIVMTVIGMFIVAAVMTFFAIIALVALVMISVAVLRLAGWLFWD